MGIKSTLTLAICTVSLTCGCDLYLSDEPFHKGTGRITGVATNTNIPAAGARVTLSGYSSNDHSATVTSDGSFLLENVPAGDHEVFIRLLEASRGHRVKAFVVADRTTDLGTMLLQHSPNLRVLVYDPELPVYNARVSLLEFPDLEPTLEGETALFPCIPQQGTYTATAQRFPFTFAPITGPENEDWDEKTFLRVVPDPYIDQSRVQVFYSYNLLVERQDPLLRCYTRCHVADGWDWSGPPCPFPIGESLGEEGLDLETNLQSTAQRISDCARFIQSDYSAMSCPRPVETTGICIDQKCQPGSSESLLEAVRIAGGHAASGCLAENVTVSSTAAGIQSATGCLGLERPEEPGPNALFVLYKTTLVDEPPRLVMTLVDGEICRIYYVGDLYATAEQSPVPPGDAPWSLYLLRFKAGQAPAPQRTEAHLAWINPAPR